MTTHPSTWFVTGASSGIGRTVVEILLARGARVAATARHTDRLQDLVEAHPGQLWTADVDVTDSAALRATVERAFDELGRVDVVFANAGRGAFGAAEELSDEQVAEQIALNMTAPIQLTRAVLPHLRAQGGGRIIATSTMGAHISSPGGSLYHASKWGLEGFLESVIPEVAPLGIGITMVEPGIVRTGFGSSMSVATAIDAYAQTPVGQVRQLVEGSDNLTGQAPGDPRRVATAIVDSADSTPAPRRLVLGSDSYQAIKGALEARLSEVESQRSSAALADFTS